MLRLYPEEDHEGSYNGCQVMCNTIHIHVDCDYFRGSAALLSLWKGLSLLCLSLIFFHAFHASSWHMLDLKTIAIMARGERNLTRWNSSWKCVTNWTFRSFTVLLARHDFSILDMAVSYALARKYNAWLERGCPISRAFGHQKFPCPISSDRSRKKERKGKKAGSSSMEGKGNVSSLVTFLGGSAANCNYYECDLR